MSVAFLEGTEYEQATQNRSTEQSFDHYGFTYIATMHGSFPQAVDIVNPDGEVLFNVRLSDPLTQDMFDLLMSVYDAGYHSGFDSARREIREAIGLY